MRLTRILWEAAAIVLLSTLLALGVNGLREDGLPLVATTPYRILVPCPEPGGEIQALAADQVRWGDPRDLVLDARELPLDDSWTAPSARSVPFDYLEPVPDDQLAELVAISSERVVVYGDGEVPDSGEELASELSGHGVRNVHFVPGGIGAVRAALRVAGSAPDEGGAL